MARRGTTNEVEIGRLEENDGVFMGFREAASLLVKDVVVFILSIIGDDDLLTAVGLQLDTIECSVTLNNIRVGGAKTFATSGNVDSLEYRGFTAAVFTEDKSGVWVTI